MSIKILLHISKKESQLMTVLHTRKKINNTVIAHKQEQTSIIVDIHTSNKKIQ